MSAASLTPVQDERSKDASRASVTGRQEAESEPPVKKSDPQRLSSEERDESCVVFEPYRITAPGSPRTMASDTKTEFEIIKKGNRNCNLVAKRSRETIVQTVATKSAPTPAVKTSKGQAFPFRFLFPERVRVRNAQAERYGPAKKVHISSEVNIHPISNQGGASIQLDRVGQAPPFLKTI